jgi:acetate CoA/acetoacetate CoA-transferase beta subunit
MSDVREFIAKNVATLLHNGDVINLGVGIPTLTTQFLPEGVEVFIQAENGVIGCGPEAVGEQIDRDIIDAGAKYISVLPGGWYFDSAISFGIIRGGHLDATILGALQVDEKGNLANWYVPGKLLPGPGGAMDLVVGANKVIIAMEHVTKYGEPKILKECTLPLTSIGTVTTIVTDAAIINRTPHGLELIAIAPTETVESVRAKTECPLHLPKDGQVGVMIQ